MGGTLKPLSGKWTGIRLKKGEMVSPGGIISPELSTYPSQIVYVIEGGDSGYKKGDILLVRSHVGQPVEISGYPGLTVFMNKNILGIFDEYQIFQEQIKEMNDRYGVGG